MLTPPDPGWPAGIRGAVSFSFDDARDSQLAEAVPLLSQYGVPATFYVSLPGLRKSAAAWRSAAETGLFEIGNHSLKHACSANFLWGKRDVLEDYTLERMEGEIREANQQIYDCVGVRPETFAYPCGQDFVGRGEERRSYAPVVARHFLAGRGFRDEYLNHPAICDLARIGGTEFDGCSFAQAREVLVKAVERGQWVVFVGHDVNHGARQSVRRDVLEELCRYCLDPKQGLWAGTVAEIARWVHRRQSELPCEGAAP